MPLRGAERLLPFHRVHTRVAARMAQKENQLTRWQQLYLEKRDEVVSVAPSYCAQNATRIFIENSKRSILDLGCGIGRDTFHLAASNLSVVGVDAAESGLMIANRHKETKQRNPVFARADARTLPFPDASFEGVYCFGMLHEFTEVTREQDIGAVMKEIDRVLAPQGLLILAVLSGEPEQGLPHVYLFTEQVFDAVTRAFQTLEKRTYNDIGCTGKTDYHVWYGAFHKQG